VSQKFKIIGGKRNRVHVISHQGVENWPELSKEEVAERLMDRFVQSLAAAPKAAE
jgi:phosphopantothenoylcysteine decarboxylase/phosphopantothenate--cysteine ligase